MAHVNDEEEGRAVGRPESSEAPAANAAKGKSSAKRAQQAATWREQLPLCASTGNAEWPDERRRQI